MSIRIQDDDPSVRRQVAALPFVVHSNGAKVLLVTTLNTCRWIPPKGWAEDGIAPHDVAAREAFEEAGVMGDIADLPIGSFDYVKRQKSGQISLCRVDVFPMRVTRLLSRWPERNRRARNWFSPDAASTIVEEPGLALLLFRFASLSPLPAVATADAEPLWNEQYG